MTDHRDDWTKRPLVLEPREVSRSWGSESWLNGTQEEGPAVVRGMEGATLADLVRQRPEVLGRWARLIFGDEVPIFTKFLRTNFPPLVHMGFCRAVEKGTFLEWLGREQELLGRLFSELLIPGEASFRDLQGAYESWAVAEALGRWASGDPGPGIAFQTALRPHLRPGSSFDAGRWLEDIRGNRARIVSVLNEVDLRSESGNLLLMAAGIPHAIFGLSHQTHPLDLSRQALQALYRELRVLAAKGSPGLVLEAAVRVMDLPSLRARNAGAPKNEAWLPIAADGGLVLVEPQQTSATTYSFADFYTPFAWKGRLVFRKGDPGAGVGRGDLEAFLRSLDFSVTPVESLRRRPVPLPSPDGALRAAAFSLVDEPETWPFFTAREVLLQGAPGAAASWPGEMPDGAFQQVVVAEGTAILEAAGGQTCELSPGAPAFLPATLEGGYALASDGPARVLLFSVPVPSDLTPREAAGAVRGRPAFLGYDPVPLAFGTSGLRGLVKDITDLEASINTKGFLRYLVATGSARPGETVTVAGDLRGSTDRILKAAARGIRDSGFAVENAGRVPTPALTFRAMAQDRPSVMVTGSHIPFDRNGIKFNRRDGEVLKSDEPGILLAVAEVRAEECARTSGASPFDPDGMLGEAASADLPPADERGRTDFVRRYLDFFSGGALRGLRVLVDQHSAVGRDILVEILSGLGAEAVPVGRSETFIPVDTENITEEALDRFDGLVRERGAALGKIDAVVSTDGDSDRPLVVAVLQEPDGKGRLVRFYGGDLLGIVVAEYLKADAAAVPVSANDAADRHLASLGIRRAMTRIGSPFVIRAMKDLEAEGFRRVVAWEANGGFLTGTDLELSGRRLAALPTRDAFLPILSALHSSVLKGIPLHALFARLPKRYSRAGLLDNVPVEVSRRMVTRFSPSDSAVVEVSFAPGGLQASGESGASRSVSPGEPLALEMEEKRAAASRFFTPGLGFGPVARINSLDGVRIFFESGDVAHIRASGNAPQLRCYACSDSAARAEEIVALCLQEPGGIYRRIQAEL